MHETTFLHYSDMHVKHEKTYGDSDRTRRLFFRKFNSSYIQNIHTYSTILRANATFNYPSTQPTSHPNFWHCTMVRYLLWHFDGNVRNSFVWVISLCKSQLDFVVWCANCDAHSTFLFIRIISLSILKFNVETEKRNFRFSYALDLWQVILQYQVHISAYKTMMV